MSVLLSSDPHAAFVAHESAIRDAIDRVLSSGQYILGKECTEFEKEFAEYISRGSAANERAEYNAAGFSVGVANGTEALEIALRAAGVRQGDLVATVANTASATISAIEQTGARPVYADVEEDTMLMSPDSLEALLSRHGDRISAVVPVHLYGHCADMPRISALSEAHGAVVIEDAAQAHGALMNGRKAGTLGALASFSFYPTKNLGALGDGGAVFTQNEELAEKVRLLHVYGWRTRYVSEIPGRNSRLDELQAAVLRVKLPFLDEENAYRDRLAARYLERLADSGLVLPVVRDNCRHVWHQFAVRTPRRDALREALLGEGISAGVLYPVPAHRQPAYLDPDVSLPITERACSEILCLPCHPGVTPEDADRVSDAVLKSLR